MCTCKASHKVISTLKDLDYVVSFMMFIVVWSVLFVWLTKTLACVLCILLEGRNRPSKPLPNRGRSKKTTHTHTKKENPYTKHQKEGSNGWGPMCVDEVGAFR